MFFVRGALHLQSVQNMAVAEMTIETSKGENGSIDRYERGFVKE